MITMDQMVCFAQLLIIIDPCIINTSVNECGMGIDKCIV